MDTQSTPSPVARARTKRPRDLSYKFQRLREKVRAAITGGELTGKLPGERILAKKFNCNAKTLSKALTDLAAEGLLERSIGRGTYVKGSAPAPQEQGPWMLLCDAPQAESPLVQALLAVNSKAQVIVGEPSTRPSFINQFTAVIDLGGVAPEPFLRDLVVRGIPIIALGHEPRTYSLDAVLVDRTLGAARLAREMLLEGHRRFIAIDQRGQTEIADALRKAAGRYPSEPITIDTCYAEEIATMIASGATAILCDSDASAALVIQKLRDLGVEIPGKVSVAAVGASAGQPAASGYYLPVTDLVDAVLKMLKETSPRRPTALWLAPAWIDRGTMAAPPGADTLPEVGLASANILQA
jgi:hypothetical protein